MTWPDLTWSVCVVGVFGRSRRQTLFTVEKIWDPPTWLRTFLHQLLLWLRALSCLTTQPAPRFRHHTHHSTLWYIEYPGTGEDNINYRCGRITSDPPHKKYWQVYNPSHCPFISRHISLYLDVDFRKYKYGVEEEESVYNTNTSTSPHTHSED